MPLSDYWLSSGWAIIIIQTKPYDSIQCSQSKRFITFFETPHPQKPPSPTLPVIRESLRHVQIHRYCSRWWASMMVSSSCMVGSVVVWCHLHHGRGRWMSQHGRRPWWRAKSCWVIQFYRQTVHQSSKNGAAKLHKRHTLINTNQHSRMLLYTVTPNYQISKSTCHKISIEKRNFELTKKEPNLRTTDLWQVGACADSKRTTFESCFRVSSTKFRTQFFGVTCVS